MSTNNSDNNANNENNSNSVLRPLSNNARHHANVQTDPLLCQTACLDSLAWQL